MSVAMNPRPVPRLADPTCAVPDAPLFEDIKNASAAIHEAIGALRRRIEPVLRPEPVAGQLKDPAAAVAPIRLLSLALWNAVDRLKEATDQVDL